MDAAVKKGIVLFSLTSDMHVCMRVLKTKVLVFFYLLNDAYRYTFPLLKTREEKTEISKAR